MRGWNETMQVKFSVGDAASTLKAQAKKGKSMFLRPQSQPKPGLQTVRDAASPPQLPSQQLVAQRLRAKGASLPGTLAFIQRVPLRNQRHVLPAQPSDLV